MIILNNNWTDMSFSKIKSLDNYISIRKKL